MIMPLSFYSLLLFLLVFTGNILKSSILSVLLALGFVKFSLSVELSCQESMGNSAAELLKSLILTLIELAVI